MLISTEYMNNMIPSRIGSGQIISRFNGFHNDLFEGGRWDKIKKQKRVENMDNQVKVSKQRGI